MLIKLFLVASILHASASWANQADSTFTGCILNDKQAKMIMAHAAEWPVSMSHFPNQYIHLSSKQAGSLANSLKSDLEDFYSLYKAVKSISRNYCFDRQQKILNRLLKKQLVSIRLANQMNLLEDVLEGVEQQGINIKRLGQHQKKAQIYFNELKEKLFEK